MIVKEQLRRQHPSQGRAQGLDTINYGVLTCPALINDVYVSTFEHRHRSKQNKAAYMKMPWIVY